MSDAAKAGNVIAEIAAIANTIAKTPTTFFFTFISFHHGFAVVVVGARLDLVSSSNVRFML